MDKPDFMSKAVFVARTTSARHKVIGRSHIGTIDDALSAYHRCSKNNHRQRADLAAVVVQECTVWLNQRAAVATDGTALRRPVVDQLRNQAFDRVKWDTYNHHKGLRGGTYNAIELHDDYKYERRAYLQSGKTETPTVANVLKAHMKAQPGDISGIIGRQGAANPSQLTPEEVLAVTRGLKDYNYDQVIYKRKRERLGMLIHFDANGIGYSDMNTPFDTGGNPWPYAMSEGGGLFAGAPGVLNHSSFLSGKKVICAGSVKAANGRITYVDNLSGHYRPNRQALWQCVCALYNSRVQLQYVEVVIAHEGNSLKKILDGRDFWRDSTRGPDQTSDDNGFNWV